MINHYRGETPAAVACLEDDLEALLAIHRIPVRHRINARTARGTGLRGLYDRLDAISEAFRSIANRLAALV